MTFPARKTQAIELLASGNLDYEEIAAAVGVTSKTLRAWRADIDFAKEVQRRALELLKDKVPAIYSVLSNKGIKDGDISALKLMLEQVNRANEDVSHATEGTITFTWGHKEPEEYDGNYQD